MKFTRPRLASTFRHSRTGLTEKEQMVYDAIKSNPSKTQIELASITGLSKGFVSKTTAKLKEMSLIERKGSRKTGYWAVE